MKFISFTFSILFFSFNINFAQSNSDCGILQTKINKAFKDHKTFRFSFLDGIKNNTSIEFEVDSSLNKHLIIEESAKKFQKYALIWIGAKVFFSKGSVTQKLETIWVNSTPEKFEFQSWIDSCNNSAKFFYEPFKSCTLIKELKYPIGTFKVYSLKIKSDIFKVWLNATTDKIERIIEVSGVKNRAWYFDVPFVISNPNLESNKKSLLGLSFFSPSYISDEEIEGNDLIYGIVETQPEFLGGEKALYKFINTTINYPERSRANDTQGAVYTSFVVEKDGSISNLKIRQSVEKELDEESLRVVRILNKKWSPGVYKGEKVRCALTLPTKFILN